MDKIASPRDLASELKKLLGYAGSQSPSRVKLANDLLSLANRVAVEGQHWNYWDKSAPRTPWGRADAAYNLARGVTFYGTPSHGGLKVSRGAARSKLSPAAIKQADQWGGAYWYEEDVAIAIPLYEVPEWREQARRKMGMKSESEHSLERTIERYFPEYFKLKEEKYELPPTPKVGEIWQFTKPVQFGSGYEFEKGDTIRIWRATSAGAIQFTADQYGPVKFRLRASQADYIEPYKGR